MSSPSFSNTRAAWWQRLLLCATLCALMLLTVGSKDEEEQTIGCCTTGDLILVGEIILQRDSIIVTPSSAVMNPGTDNFAKPFPVTTESKRLMKFDEVGSRQACFPFKEGIIGENTAIQTTIGIKIGKSSELPESGRDIFLFEIGETRFTRSDWKARAEKLLATGKQLRVGNGCNIASFLLEASSRESDAINLPWRGPENLRYVVTIPITAIAADLGIGLP